MTAGSVLKEIKRNKSSRHQKKLKERINVAVLKEKHCLPSDKFTPDNFPSDKLFDAECSFKRL